MPANFDDAFEQVKQLGESFKAHASFYLSPAYQEAEARRDFIDKFLIALGWDVNHDTQKNPYEQEVKVERKEHGVSQRRADYAFYLAPNFRDVKFYIEAKKPHGDIATADNSQTPKKMKKNKPNHGGRRAGRPATGRKPVTINLRPEAIAVLRSLKIPMGHAIEKMIADGK